MAENKRITLHPLDSLGKIDTSINLYPKTLIDGIVDREGEEVEVALKSDIPTNYVTTNTEQTITGEKTFTQPINASKVIFDSIGNSYIRHTANPSSELNITQIIGPVDINGGIEVLNRAGGYGNSHLITFKDQYTGEFSFNSINCNYVFPTADKVNNTTYTIATTEDIPTNYVTTDTDQTISGAKKMDAAYLKTVGDLAEYTVSSFVSTFGVGYTVAMTSTGSGLYWVRVSSGTGPSSYYVYIIGLSGYLSKLIQASDTSISLYSLFSTYANKSVTLTGDQTITGDKTFRGSYFSVDNGDSYINVTSDSIYQSYTEFDYGAAFHSAVTFRNPSNASRVLTVPDMSDWTANKTIATTDQCGTKLYKHNLGFLTTSGGKSFVVITTNPTPIDLEHNFEFQITDGVTTILDLIAENLLLQIFYHANTHALSVKKLGGEWDDLGTVEELITNDVEAL